MMPHRAAGPRRPGAVRARPRAHAEPVGARGRRSPRACAPRWSGSVTRSRSTSSATWSGRSMPAPVRACCSTRTWTRSASPIRAAWSADPAGELRDGRLYGRGSIDMKGPLAALVHGAAAAALSGGRVVVSASIAEEMIEGFATVAVARRVRPDVAVICEPSSRRVVVGQRGRAELMVEVERPPVALVAAGPGRQRGRGDGRRPARRPRARAARSTRRSGRRSSSSPTWSAARTRRCRCCPTAAPPRSTAARCRARARRTCSSQLRDSGRRGGRAARRHRRGSRSGSTASTPTRARRVEAPNFAPPGTRAPTRRSPARRSTRSAPRPATGCSAPTAAARRRSGIPTIGYGPGDETLAHRVDEHIELDELEAGARDYAALAAALTA